MPRGANWDLLDDIAAALEYRGFAAKVEWPGWISVGPYSIGRANNCWGWDHEPTSGFGDFPLLPHETDADLIADAIGGLIEQGAV